MPLGTCNLVARHTHGRRLSWQHALSCICEPTRIGRDPCKAGRLACTPLLLVTRRLWGPCNADAGVPDAAVMPLPLPAGSGGRLHDAAPLGPIPPDRPPHSSTPKRGHALPHSLVTLCLRTYPLTHRPTVASQRPRRRTTGAAAQRQGPGQRGRRGRHGALYPRRVPAAGPARQPAGLAVVAGAAGNLGAGGFRPAAASVHRFSSFIHRVAVPHVQQACGLYSAGALVAAAATCILTMAANQLRLVLRMA